MLILVAVAIFIASLVYLKRSTGWYAFAGLSFLLFGFLLRMISATYVGLWGPVYTQHFSRFIRDDGFAGIVFAMSLTVLVMAAAVLLRPKALLSAIHPLRRPVKDNLGTAAIASFALYLLLMYGDMLLRGVIPLFTFMERDVYTKLYAGIFHKIFFEYSFMFAFLWGYFFVRPRLYGGAYDLRYLGILAAAYLYFILTGHRFSIFFIVSSFFAIPTAAAWMQSRFGKLPPSSDPQQTQRILRLVKAAVPVIGLLFVGLTSFALYNSLYNVRSYADPVQAFVQRTLVQPTEFWWVTWESTIRGGQWDPAEAFRLMFITPLVDTQNTGIQFLMIKELGYERAAELIRLGEQFAGGYPEVLFELLGPYASWPAMILFAFVTVALLRLAFTATCNQRLGTAIFSVFLFYGFSILYIGGMLNFVMAPTFWIKVAGLAFFWVIERRREQTPRPSQRAVPW